METNSITITVPLSFTQHDFESQNWPVIRKSLLDNVRIVYEEDIGRITREKGWKR